MNVQFTPRSEIPDFEWDAEKKQWQRLPLDREVLAELTKRSTLNGLWRVGLFLFFLVGSAAAASIVSRYNFWLAIPLVYLYYFFYGFWVAIAHELQHKTVFAEGADAFSEILFFFVQALIWNSPRYARVSHRLHHRYTMVHGTDPETDWPRIFTSKWLKRYLWSLIFKILVAGAVIELGREILRHIGRIVGKKDRMMREFCGEKDILMIRIESAAILLFHAGVILLSILYRRWEPLVFVTLAWQIGNPIEFLWHQTEHIGRLYDVNDYRLCTRSIRVSPFLRLIYWGLDDHVDHHMFPAVPSRNLPKLHAHLKKNLPEPKGIIECWREMFAIAREKDRSPENEYIPVDIQSTTLNV
jgi:fatty acid desaturase